MAEYSYTAVNKQGKEVKGSLQAKDSERVRSKLKADGLLPVSIKEQSVFTKDINISFGSPVKARDLSVFCRQFTSILRAGVMITEALTMLGDQTNNKAFKKAIIETKAAVEKGETLGNSMRLNRKVFPAMMINMIDAGEASGNLDIALSRMATHFEKSAKLRALIKKALIYPVVLICVAVIVVIIMSVYVIPKFATMFESMGTELPAITRAVMGISDFFMNKWYVALIAVGLFIVAWKAFTKTEFGDMTISKFKMKAPIFGTLVVKNYSARLARTLSTLTGAGISITTAIEITGKSMSNLCIKKALDKTKKEVEQGVNLSEPIRKCGLFPPMVHQMIKIGEETGNMEEMLDKVAEYYEEEVEIATQSLTALMEPLIIVVLGVIVGVLVLALYQPMITMYGGMDSL